MYSVGINEDEDVDGEVTQEMDKDQTVGEDLTPPQNPQDLPEYNPPPGSDDDGSDDDEGGPALPTAQEAYDQHHAQP